MPAHSTLTGADLHEPKGVAAASANTVYVANGSGSGTWIKITTSQLAASILNANKATFHYDFTDIGTAYSTYYPIPKACTIDKIVVCINALTATAATVLTFRNNAGGSMGTISIPNGAVQGSIHTLTPASNNTFTADTKLQVDSDGGTSTSVPCAMSFNITLT